MRNGGLGLAALALAVSALLAVPATAQSFDCAKAQAPVDRAICAAPQLRRLDESLAQAYAAALARDRAGADAIRQAQRAWLRARAACVKATADQACLARAYTERIAALTPPPPVPPPAAAPLPAIAQAAATLDRSGFATAGETDVALRVTTPGRFAIRAKSATGTALQLVDMLTGPGPREGWPGKADGRIDALLDIGTYRVRAVGAKDAAGQTTLSVTGFAASGPPGLAPGYTPATLQLRDLQVQGLWFVVGPNDAATRIEAAGRSLRALKLWRDGRDLVDLPERVEGIAPVPAHPLTDIVLSGKVPPGTYLIAAYGGPALPWADGAADQPLYLRTGQSADLLAGGAAGSVGPFGSEVFAVPPDAVQALLLLAQPADVTLLALDGETESGRVAIARTQREPAALLDLPEKPKQARSVVLHAALGQKFVLRPVAAAQDMPGRPGRYWFAAAEYAFGGDEAPAAAALFRIAKDGTGTAIGSAGVPEIGPGRAWRTRFNFRGETTLLFRVAAPVTAAVRADGPRVTAQIATLDGAVMNATGNGAAAARWALSPAWYALHLTARPDAIGILDLTLGPPGLLPAAPEAAQPVAPVLPLGEHEVDKDTELHLFVNDVPGFVGGLIARPAPVDLGTGPVVATVPPGQSFAVATRAPRAGMLMLRNVAGGPPLVLRPIAKGADATPAFPTADHARTLALALLPPETAQVPSPAPPAALVELRDGTPRFLDLARDRTARFALTVAQGGLYRVATLGRLDTEGRIGTAFVPSLATGRANGVGRNMLLLRYLRAGAYRLDVTARGSAGRAGVLAVPAPLAQGMALAPGETVRASLAAGSGVAFPVRIAAAGRYHLDLLGDGRMFTVRLDDPDGWPLEAAAPAAALEEDLAPGTYRLTVLPQSVDARVVARLRRVLPPVPIIGHGPHALPFGATQSAEWREPASRGQARTPDTWTFGLVGPAHVVLDLRGDGMLATLHAAGNAAPKLRVLGGAAAGTDLAAGSYVVAAQALGRNDRLAYTVKLTSTELQPNAPRSVTLPAKLPFSLATPRVVSLTSFGPVPLRAVLRAADGSVLARAVGRADDWNIGLSQALPSGHYRLDLEALPAPPPKSGDAAQENGDAPPQQTEITLALPPDLPDATLAADGSARVNGAGVSRVALPPAAPGTLLVLAAAAQAEVVLALEQRSTGGAWQTIGRAQGTAPMLAMPAGATALRVAVWTVDGVAAPIRLAVRAATAAAQPLGRVALNKLSLPGLAQGWAVARVADPGAAVLRIAPPETGLRAGVLAGRPALPATEGMIVPQADTVWLVAPADAPAAIDVARAAVPADAALPVSLPDGGRATLPAAAGPCAYVAASGLGQPGLDAGRGMGVAGSGDPGGTAFALCGGAPVTVWNAGGGAALRVGLRRRALDLLPERGVDAAFTGLIPAHAALPLRLPAGRKRIDASLAAQGALVAGWHAGGAVTAWAGDAALSRSLTGDWTDALLVNLGDAPAPAALTLMPDAVAPSLAAGSVFRRFFGARGSLVLHVMAQAGQHLVVAGPAHATVLLPDGQVRRGRRIALDGTASVVLAHGTGPLAAWLEGPSASPWPAAAQQDVTPPQHLTLGGTAMALRLAPGAPVLLRVRGTAPAILTLGDAPPSLYGSGIAFDRYLPAGMTVLRLLSPTDGPLSGTLDLAAFPVAEIAEGTGAAVAVAPGDAAVFGFAVTTEGAVGLGVRADPDIVAVRLLDDAGRELGHGVSMLRKLAPGHYLLEASVPPDGATTLVRPTVLGITPHVTPPPPEVVRRLLLAAGFAPPAAAP